MADTLWRVAESSRRGLLTGWLTDKGCVEMSVESLAGVLEELEGGDRNHTIEITLHHPHLPKLDDSGRLDYDVETNRFRRSSDEHADIELSP